MKKIFLPICVVLFFAFSSLAFAQSNYIVGKIGSYTPESNDLTGFDTDFTGEVAVGHYLSPNFAVEAGVGYLQTSGDVVVSDSQVFFAREDINATFLEGTAKLVFPVPYGYYSTEYRPFMDFYVGAGGGVYFAHDNFLGNDTVGGVHVLGGVDFDVDRNFFLGLEAKYLWARPFDTSIDGFIFSGDIGYRF